MLRFVTCLIGVGVFFLHCLFFVLLIMVCTLMTTFVEHLFVIHNIVCLLNLFVIYSIVFKLTCFKFDQNLLMVVIIIAE